MNNVLVDTQALIWFAEGSAKLSDRARLAIDDLTLIQFASAASLWEMAIKMPLGKLTLKHGLLQEFAAMLQANQIEILPVTLDDALAVADLPQLAHKDPFDRLIAAQCLRQELTLVSIDEAFDDYGVRRIW